MDTTVHESTELCSHAPVKVSMCPCDHASIQYPSKYLRTCACYLRQYAFMCLCKYMLPRQVCDHAFVHCRCHPSKYVLMNALMLVYTTRVCIYTPVQVHDVVTCKQYLTKYVSMCVFMYFQNTASWKRRHQVRGLATRPKFPKLIKIKS